MSNDERVWNRPYIYMYIYIYIYIYIQNVGIFTVKNTINVLYRGLWIVVANNNASP